LVVHDSTAVSVPAVVVVASVGDAVFTCGAGGGVSSGCSDEMFGCGCGDGSGEKEEMTRRRMGRACMVELSFLLS
jgi:hypothetical protein